MVKPLASSPLRIDAPEEKSAISEDDDESPEPPTPVCLEDFLRWASSLSFLCRLDFDFGLDSSDEETEGEDEDDSC